MRATRLLPGIVLLVGALLAGCSSPTPGAPAPAAPVASTPADPPELALDGVDPCSLISAADRQAFGLTVPEPDESPIGFPICRWMRAEITFQLAMIFGANPPDFTNYSANHEVIRVDGYAALQMTQPGADPGESCILSIGVRPDQVVQVLVGDRFSSTYPSETAICEDAKRFAHAALAALQRG
ncbi:DUF3558 domain-containing protein [Pseudonocardia dioxanivorans]|uniref:DUF3558 domain-containing protein n=1 Tax=Pseudonocardia dioxanivorans TaxID=240495 RepID=UPI00131A49DC|nr:DUF3558 domain-containing protein [Pseudonocardia dioxanivorans]